MLGHSALIMLLLLSGSDICDVGGLCIVSEAKDANLFPRGSYESLFGSPGVNALMLTDCDVSTSGDVSSVAPIDVLATLIHLTIIVLKP